MKVWYTIINFILKVRIWIVGYNTTWFLKQKKFLTIVLDNWKVKDANNWGSIQVNSNSVSIKQNFVESLKRGRLYLRGEETWGTNWDGLSEIRPYSGSEIIKEAVKSNRFSAIVDWSGLKKGSWAGWWIRMDELYQGKHGVEFDFEVWGYRDELQLKVSYHWFSVVKDNWWNRKFNKKNIGKVNTYTFTWRIPYIAKAKLTLDTSKRTSRAYVNDRLVFMFDNKHKDVWNAYYSLYALKDSNGVLTPTNLKFEECKLEKRLEKQVKLKK